MSDWHLLMVDGSDIYYVDVPFDTIDEALQSATRIMKVHLSDGVGAAR